MRIISLLFHKKFDYVVFPIGFIAILMLIVNLFSTSKMDTSMLWGQIFMVVLYYLVTRGKAERNFIKQGIEPVIVLSLFGILVILGCLANVIILMDLV